MKKKLSIKARITLWYAVVIVSICVLALCLLYAMSEYAQTAYCRDTLESAAVVILDEMEVEHGIVEIDADIDEVPNVYAALFDPGGSLIYGRKRVEAPFEEGGVRRVRNGEHHWMILDTHIDVPDHERIWLRLHMSADLTTGVARITSVYGLWLLPLLAAVALLGGYLLTSRALRPVLEMTRAASSIAGGGDLSAGTELLHAQPGNDELHALAATLSDMLERLRASFEHERQFTSDAAHELRTPLSSMRAQGEYALSRTDAAEKDEAIAQMLEKNEEMRAMVDQLLMIARLDSGQMPMEDDVELSGVVQSVAEDMELVAQERDIRIETKLRSARVRGNRAMITRALVNLVDNAIRYGREGGLVRIAIEADAQDVFLHVSDDGAGIAVDSLAHVFERFWREDSARTTPGTGIGLSIVASAARAHGGRAEAESSLGAGSRFTIRLPKRK